MSIKMGTKWKRKRSRRKRAGHYNETTFFLISIHNAVLQNIEVSTKFQDEFSVKTLRIYLGGAW